MNIPRQILDELLRRVGRVVPTKAIRCGLTDWTYREVDDICNGLGGCAERQKPAWSTAMREVLPGEIADRARAAISSLGLPSGGLGLHYAAARCGWMSWTTQAYGRWQRSSSSISAAGSGRLNRKPCIT